MSNIFCIDIIRGHMTVINLVHGLSYLENRTEYIYYLEYEI